MSGPEDRENDAWFAVRQDPWFLDGLSAVLYNLERMIQHSSFRVYIARPRGFCAGVDRAIDIVRLALKIYGPPVYVRHAIVHNHKVVRDLEQEGAVFVERIEDIPPGSVTVFSAHGVSPQVREAARARNLQVLDATCPLVTKVHLEARRYAKEGYTIFLIGHRGHVEVEGTMGEAPEHMVLIETPEDARTVQVSNPERVAVLTQTTLSVDDTREILDILARRFPALHRPRAEDICYATQNRQDAVKTLAQRVDLLLVIGSRESSNSNRLREVGEKQGIPSYLIDCADEILPEWVRDVDAVGVTAGASTPEELVQDVIARLRDLGATRVEEIEGREENILFTLPRPLQEKARELGLSLS